MADERRLAAIMFTDLVGYSALSHRHEDLSLRILQDHRERLRARFAARGGVEIKTLGDGFLVEFPSALEALRCAFEIQQAMHERDVTAPVDAKVSVRIGIHVGDVVHREGDIYGDAVNVAARLEPLAEPGGICLTGQVYDQVRNKFEFPILSTGTKRLKNIPQPFDTYRVRLPWEARAEPSHASEVRRLAVLPLANISPDPKDEYFADGLTEELISGLSQLHELRVIARTSVLPYKLAPKPIVQVGTELGVDSVLEGSVRKAGDRLRITVQLIDVASQEHVWAQTYDRKLEDVFAVQTEVSKHIADALRIRLGPDDQRRLEGRPTVRPESYLEYLRGRNLMHSNYTVSVRRAARDHFERAVDLDASNAPAHAGLADALRWLAPNEPDSSIRADMRRAARALAVRAIELEPDLAEAHCSLGVFLAEDYEWGKAEAALKRALSLNPSNVYARFEYARLLENQARAEEALRELALAEETDPRSILVLDEQFILLIHLRRLEEANAKVHRIGDLEHYGEAYHTDLAWYHYARADFARALEEIELAEQFGLSRDVRKFVLGWIDAHKGNRERALETFRRLESQPGGFADWSLAWGYALTGELDECFRILENCVDERAPLGPSWTVGAWRLDPLLEGARKDARFKRLLSKMNLT